MNVDSLKERLRKMKALADFGYGGERDAAERLIGEICEKHGISIDEIEDGVEREHTVAIASAWERNIFIQLLGLMRIEQYGDRYADKLKLKVETTWVWKRGRKRRRAVKLRYFTNCTDLQWLELTSKFEVLCAAYKKQLKAFPLAFLLSNDLLMPYDPNTPPSTAKEDEEYAIAVQLSAGIEQTCLYKQLESKVKEGR